MAKVEQKKVKKEKLSKEKENKSDEAPKKVQVSKDKYENMKNKKRKSSDATVEQVDTEIQAKKPRVAMKESKNNEIDEEAPAKAKKFDKAGSKFNQKGIKSNGKKYENGSQSKAKPPVDPKELKKQRRQKKLAENYDVSINMKKIWETLRRADTTEETKKKLCSALYDHVKGRISQISLAHDTCRVIECLVQHGNERHRIGVFDELKDSIVELAKSKYGRFLVKKMLTYGTKEQKDMIIKSFSGKVPKLIKHSFACQIVESIFNEHASYAQRNQMIMEFFDPTFALFNDKSYKSLKDIFEAQPFSKEKIMNSLKETLSSCINKTLLMFSLIHRIFLEYFQNCDQKQKSEMIDLLSEHLVHMIHTKDGANVAMNCIWHGDAKDRKKIIKGMKSFFLKVASEEYGHLVLLAIFDSVDDTKLVSKVVLEELFRTTNELFNNEYGRKVITYILAPRDTRFFLKDYTKRLETGDNKETSKKDPEIRRKELVTYSKSHLKNYVSKELSNLLSNGASGILLPDILDKLEQDADEIIRKLADILLDKPFESSNEQGKEAENKNQHLIEEATSHFVIKKIIEQDAERIKNGRLSLGEALLLHKNSINMLSWIDCNRGCFTLVKLIETNNESNRKQLKTLLQKGSNNQEKLNQKFAGAKLLAQKLNEVNL